MANLSRCNVNVFIHTLVEPYPIGIVVCKDKIYCFLGVRDQVFPIFDNIYGINLKKISLGNLLFTAHGLLKLKYSIFNKVDIVNIAIFFKKVRKVSSAGFHTSYCLYL